MGFITMGGRGGGLIDGVCNCEGGELITVGGREGGL